MQTKEKNNFKPPAVRDKKPPRRFSLTWRMLQMLLLCWVLPVVLIVLGSSLALRNSLIEQSVESLAQSLEAAVQMSDLYLESAVSANRNISYLGAIKSAWSAYQNDEDKVTLYANARAVLEQQYQTNELFYSTILLFYDFADEPIYIINGAAGGTDRVRQDATEIFATAQALGATLDTQIGFFSVGERVFMVRNLVDSRYQQIALLMMELNTALIFGEFAGLDDVKAALITVGDVNIDTLTVLPAAQSGYALSDLAQDASNGSGVHVSFYDNALFVTVQQDTGDYSFAYDAIVSAELLQAQWRMVQILTILLACLSLPLSALVFRFFARHVTRPLHAMMDAAVQIRHEEYGVQLPEGLMQSQELGALADDFNKMSLTLQQQFDHIYKEELALRDARIMALQSQINPHFLNNTLEIINWEARMQGNIKVCNMLESLSTMLSAAMDRNHNRTVHLSQELMYVDAYLYIINERLGKRLIFERDIPDEFLDVQVPRLVLQPLLENAVEHGITPVQKGRIALRARQQGDWLLLCVENDGALSPENLGRIQRLLSSNGDTEAMNSGSLGLRNVHQRLRILYGEESGLLVDITKKDVTVFQLKIKLA